MCYVTSSLESCVLDNQSEIESSPVHECSKSWIVYTEQDGKLDIINAFAQSIIRPGNGNCIIYLYALMH